MSTRYTIEQIVQMVQMLNPTEAATHTDGTLMRLCTTSVIEKLVLPTGEEIPLERVGGRYASGYIRVSTPEQRAKGKTARATAQHRERRREKPARHDGGYSEEDQALRIIRYCAERRWSFRIFSDAALDGSLPYENTTLIEEMRAARASRYKDAFSAAFLQDPHNRYTADDIASMRQYMEQVVRRISSGETPSWTGNDESADTFANERPVGRGRSRKPRAEFRPGLTCLIDALRETHTVLVQDLSRIARSYEIVSSFIQHLYKADTQIVGLLQPLDMVNTSRGHGDVLITLLSWLDGLKLQETVTRILCSAETMLLAKRPYGTVPSWIEVDQSGTTRINEDAAMPVHEMVRMYLAGHGYQHIATALGDAGHPAPYGKYWQWKTVRRILHSPHLLGFQSMFGKLWPCYPPLISEEEYQRIQDIHRRRLETASYDTTPRRADCFLLAGLIRCRCGRHTLLSRWHTRGYPQYRCLSSSHERRDAQVAHTTLNADDVDRFMDQVMCIYGTEVLQLLDFANEGRRFQQEIKEIHEQVAQIRRQRFEAEPVDRPSCVQQVEAGCQIDESDDEYGAFVEKMVRKLTRTYTVRDERLQGTLREGRGALEAQIPAQALEETVRRWAASTGTEKNSVLRKIFSHFEIHGEPGEEYLLPILRTPVRHALPPIHFRTQIRGKAIWRRMPSLDDWVFAREAGAKRQSNLMRSEPMVAEATVEFVENAT